MMFRSSSTSATTALVSYFAWCWVFIFATTSLPQAYAADASQWRSRSIYQLITDRFARTDGSTTFPCNATAQLYCGGTFQGIINQLDYIQGMGFTAIWISPVVENIENNNDYGEGYHGFWTNNIHNINKHFGDVDTLKKLSAEVHRRGMYLMVDVVINNIALSGPGDKAVYSDFEPPFNDKKLFHPFKYVTDYGDQLDAQNGWLGDKKVSLPDLNTELPEIQKIWQDWTSELIANYSLDGLRIDAAKHVNKPFWAPFQKAVNVFTMGEVYTAQTEMPNATCDWSVNALSSVLNFPTYYNIYQALSNSSNEMGGLGYIVDAVSKGCHDSTILGTFSENHDVARFASYTTDLAQQTSALVYTLMGDGIPVVYYGAEQGFSGGSVPTNREALWTNPTGYDTNSPLYLTVKALNIARTAVNDELAGIDYTNWSGYWAYKIKLLFITPDILVFRKGYDTSIITAITNVGSEGKDVGPYHLGDTNMVQGDAMLEIISCNHTVAGLYGEFDITLKKGMPQVWVPARYLKTVQGLCPEVLRKLNSTGATNKRSAASPNFSIQPHNLALYLGSLLFGVFFVLFAGS